MNNFTEKEALYILRHRKQYTDDEIDKAINKIKRINSHRLEYIKRYKSSLKNSVPKKKVEDMLEEYQERKRYYDDNGLEEDDVYFSIEEVIEVLQRLLKEE